MNWKDKILGMFRQESGPEVRGRLQFKGALHFPKGGSFASSFEGKMSSRHTLVLAEGAEVRGDVRGENCRIQGWLDGRLDASGSVQVDGSGFYSGKLSAKSLRVEAGAEFQSDLVIEPQLAFNDSPPESILLPPPENNRAAD